ncbi:MAG TPA: hypothetical protein VK524_21250 [Polyangiaceae bacterium]|nr:hypothetical protein [Polyangiaceae bacterium]
MKLWDLAAIYLVVGAACAVALYRRTPEKGRAAWVNALTAVPLWPLWMPIAWTARRETAHFDAHASERVRRILSALEEGLACVLGTPLERLLNGQSAEQIRREVERIAARHQELVRLLGREEFCPEAAERKLSALEAGGAPVRVRASARLHLENVRRLAQLAERDRRALDELLGLVDALRTQLVLVRLSGSSAEGVGDIVSELWTRLESLNEASDEITKGPPHPAESPA